MLVEPHSKGFKQLAAIRGLITCDPWQNARALHLNAPQLKGSEHWGVAPCWASPTVARGKVYLHYSDRLMCYDLMNK